MKHISNAWLLASALGIGTNMPAFSQVPSDLNKIKFTEQEVVNSGMDVECAAKLLAVGMVEDHYAAKIGDIARRHTMIWPEYKETRDYFLRLAFKKETTEALTKKAFDFGNAHIFTYVDPAKVLTSMNDLSFTCEATYKMIKAGVAQPAPGK